MIYIRRHCYDRVSVLNLKQGGVILVILTGKTMAGHSSLQTAAKRQREAMPVLGFSPSSSLVPHAQPMKQCHTHSAQVLPFG